MKLFWQLWNLPKPAKRGSADFSDGLYFNLEYSTSDSDSLFYFARMSADPLIAVDGGWAKNFVPHWGRRAIYPNLFLVHCFGFGMSVTIVLGE